jgi:uncharacterized protein with GYD domain
MPTYLALLNWTDQGIRNVKDSMNQYDHSTQLAEKHGVRFEQVYWTVGPYDIAAIFEAPDDESLSAFLLELSSEGNIRTTTLRAYNREEMSGILESVARSRPVL